MEKEFIPYEQALALKELGFDGSCFSLYFNNGEFSNFIHAYKVNDEVVEKTNSVLAPTFSQAFRWFREKYNMNAIVSYYGKNQYFIELLDYKGNQLVQVEEIEDNTFWTYEEAELECLKKLIEIVKTKETC